MDERLNAAWRVLPEYLSQHVLLCAAALALALVLCAPLTLLALRRPRFAGPLVAAASLVQTIPGLALMALFYPVLLALSALTTSVFGRGVPALGFLPALLALTLYAMLPILRNAVAGLRGVDADIIEAARGVGMTEWQILARVQGPLSAPVVMAGVRTAAVWTIGAATLATPVGQTTLGNYIFSGLQTENWVTVIFGCVMSALVAIVADLALGAVEHGVAARDRRRIGAGALVILAGVGAALFVGYGSGAKTYVIGAKNFSEQFILAEAMSRRIEGQGASARIQQGLGSAIVYRALVGSDLDVYVDYAGTLWNNALGRTDTPPHDQMIADLTRTLQERDDVRVLGALGFENAYALAMRPERAAALGVKSIDDLARVAPQLTLGADLEFLERPEWATLRNAYGLAFKATRSFNPTFVYRALATGEADVISAFSSDGRIAAEKLVLLADPKGAIPAYDALVLLSPKRRDDPVLVRALTPLIGAIKPEAMRAANYAADRDTDKQTPAQAAETLLTPLR
ncbi:MAG: opuBB [Hyphomicrobiales bacterium]|nr:opuBB [Hyphomicrobiales bacterium]